MLCFALTQNDHALMRATGRTPAPPNPYAVPYVPQFTAAGRRAFHPTRPRPPTAYSGSTAILVARIVPRTVRISVPLASRISDLNGPLASLAPISVARHRILSVPSGAPSAVG